MERRNFNMAGTKVGKLTVLQEVEKSKFNHRRWECICECGKKCIVLGTSLRSPTKPTKSCGCIVVQAITKAVTTHGMTYSSEYRTWLSMKQRCYNKNHDKYPTYGGRGIIMSESWRNSFIEFFKDMGPKPTNSHTIDRINNDLGYFAGNCAWATKIEQGLNRKTTIWIEFNGVRKPISHWAQEIRAKEGTIKMKLQSGLSFEEIYNLYKSKKGRKKYKNSKKL